MPGNCLTAVDRRFPIQQISEISWLKATAANAAADYAAGFQEVVDQFLDGRPDWQRFYEMLHTTSRTGIEEYLVHARQQSLAFLTLMLTGACNADCPICYTHNKNEGAYQMGEEELVAILLVQHLKIGPAPDPIADAFVRSAYEAIAH